MATRNKPERMMNKDGSLKGDGAAAVEPDAVDAPVAGSFETIWFTGRGIVHIAGLDNGNEVVLRFRAHEIDQLESRMGRGILSLLNEESLGIGFLKRALMVGAAHMYVGKKGKPRRSFTEETVERWIDRCEDNGVPFDELLTAVVKAVVGGMPGGQKYLDAMNDTDVEEAEEESGARPPSPSAT